MHEPKPLNAHVLLLSLQQPENDNGDSTLERGLWLGVDAQVSERPVDRGDTGGIDPEVLRQKLIDMNTPGFMAEFDPDEAEALGAFVEDALSEEDALDATCDLLDLITVRDVGDVSDDSTISDVSDVSHVSHISGEVSA